MKFRYVTPTCRGQWHPTKREAEKAAVKSKAARKDDNGRIYLDPQTVIERKA